MMKGKLLVMIIQSSCFVSHCWSHCESLSDIVHRANFHVTFLFVANSFSQKLITLNDISCEYSRDLANKSPNCCFH